METRVYHQKWYQGKRFPLPSGSGAVVTTPLQLARTIAASPWAAYFKQPHLLIDEPAGTGRLIFL